MYVYMYVITHMTTANSIYDTLKEKGQRDLGSEQFSQAVWPEQAQQKSTDSTGERQEKNPRDPTRDQLGQLTCNQVNGQEARQFN